MKKFNEELIRRIKIVGKDIYENPEKYVPDHEFVKDLSLTCNLVWDGEFTNLPEVNIDVTVYPAPFAIRGYPEFLDKELNVNAAEKQ